MPRRVKPRWGWKPTYDKEDLDRRLGTIDENKLGQALLFDDTNSARTAIAEVKQSLTGFYWANFCGAYPTAAEIKAARDEFANAAESFKFCLENLDWRTQENVRRRLQRGALENDGTDLAEDLREVDTVLFEDPSKILRMIELLGKALDTSRVNLPKKASGKPPNIGMIRLIRNLALIFERYTGKNAADTCSADAINGGYRGPFVDFAEYVINTFDPKPAESQWSVGDYVRRVIGDRADPRWQISPDEGEVMPFPQNYDPMLPVFEYTVTEYKGLADGTVQQTETRPGSITRSILRPRTADE